MLIVPLRIQRPEHLKKRDAAQRGQLMGFLCVDGHVRAYHGHRTISRAFVARHHAAMPPPPTTASTIAQATGCCSSAGWASTPRLPAGGGWIGRPLTYLLQVPSGTAAARAKVYRASSPIPVVSFSVTHVGEAPAPHPGALEAGAVAQPDEHSGEVVALFVVRKDPSLTEKGVIDYCRQSLSAYKVPKHVYFRAELPKTNVGKILRKALREELAKV